MSAKTASTTSSRTWGTGLVCVNALSASLGHGGLRGAGAFVGYGLTRKDTKPLAKELLRRFGSIRGAGRQADELLQVPVSGRDSWPSGGFCAKCWPATQLGGARENLGYADAVAHMAQSRLAGCSS